jgi:DNA-binding SARP family transcriptional activator
MRQTCAQLVAVEGDNIRLAETVQVDLDESLAQATRLVSGAELQASDVNVTTLTGELLPNWDEDWLLLERERVRLTMIRGLEALGRRMIETGRYFEAIDSAYAAIAAEPLRETAHEILIDVHLAERNLAGARQQFATLDLVLSTELGIHPSPALSAKVYSV